MAVERVELKACPFCGPRSEESGEWPQLFEHRSDCVSEWSVRCGCCGIDMGDEDREVTIAAWNTRSSYEGELRKRFEPRFAELKKLEDDVQFYSGNEAAGYADIARLKSEILGELRAALQPQKGRKL